MSALKRVLAGLQTWWVRLFVIVLVAWIAGLLAWWIAVPALIILQVLSMVRAARRDQDLPIPVSAPVEGRWAALNSPATSVPSHGIRAYGQAFAIDIAHPRPPGASTRLGWGWRQRPASDYSCFRSPVYAVRAGTVAAVTSGLRDHRARNTWPGILYLMTLEGFVRELGGARFIVGNHVVLDHGEGVYSVYAHLRQGSVTARVGDRVEAGQLLGEVGNSGNSSEPHLHFQLMDHPRLCAAAGLPFRWMGLRQDPDHTDPTWSTKPISMEIVEGLPATGQVFESRPTRDRDD